ncbi:hypothetical protein CIP107503_00608 [Corynebacterium diphtheriae]|nr:hypothetical protein CIP107503_00608 [Corynebacterium diphtheriae]
MDIKIGFSDSPRELVVSSREDHNEIVDRIHNALRDAEGVLDLVDHHGNRYLVRNARIAYVEVGSTAPRTVGFAGA